MIHKKLILHTVHLYLSQALKKDECYQPETIRKVKSKLDGYFVFHRFSKAEHDYLVALGEHEEMKEIRSVLVDYSVYGMSLLAEAMNDYDLHGISKETIMGYSASMIKDRLGLKQRSTQDHQEVVEIIEQSKETAKRYYEYTKDQICGMQ